MSKNLSTIKELSNELAIMKKKHIEYPAASILRDRLKKEAEHTDYHRYTKLTELMVYVISNFLFNSIPRQEGVYKNNSIFIYSSVHYYLFIFNDIFFVIFIFNDIFRQEGFLLLQCIGSMSDEDTLPTIVKILDAHKMAMPVIRRG
jgi:hypothetical protein